VDPITSSRAWVAAALEAIPALAGVHVYDGPVEVVTAPAVIVAPAADWLRTRTQGRTDVVWDVTVAVTFTGGNAAALDALAALLWPILQAFPGAQPVLAPAVTKYGQADLYAATITVPTMTTTEAEDTP
jgi:hypothetical protein